MNFNEAFERLIGHEGVFSTDPNDRGNWTSGRIGVGSLKGTKYGISAAAYPHLDIINLTLDDAKTIYLADYWKQVRADELPVWLRFDAFDAAVNSGPAQARLWVQRAVGAVADGKIGPKTLACAHRADPGMALLRFNGHRLNDMTDMPGWKTQNRGWARRIAKNQLRGGA